MPESKFSFRTTRDFDSIAQKLALYCGIRRQLASKRLHELKSSLGLSGGDNVRFDMSGNVYDIDSGELLGSLTQGGAKEEA